MNFWTATLALWVPVVGAALALRWVDEYLATIGGENQGHRKYAAAFFQPTTGDLDHEDH
jgi:hypothetical protein